MNKNDEKLADELIEKMDKSDIILSMFEHNINAGTEEMTTEDTNTPTLSIIQKISEKPIENQKVGWLFRSDTSEQAETFDVDLVYVTSKEMDNFNKTGVDTVKVYYGFFHGTNEPFQMYIRGWSMNGHRELQTELVNIRNKYRMPMYGMKITVSTKKVEGEMKDGGKYSVYRIVFTVNKDEKGKPIMDLNGERADFLYKSIAKFHFAAGENAQATPNDEKMTG